MIGQGHCVLCGIEVLDDDEAGEVAVSLTITAAVRGSRAEWQGEAHPACVSVLWGRLAVPGAYPVIPPAEEAPR